MGKIRSLFAPILLAALGGARELDSEDVSKCIILVEDEVVGLQPFTTGLEIRDDRQELKAANWEPGMHVRAVNYCINEDLERILSFQLLIGTNDEDIDDWRPLKKHGHKGGKCRRWTLSPDDYIRRVQYTYNYHTMSVVQLVFQTSEKETRVFGRGEGVKVMYEFNAFQPFIGFYGYQDQYRMMAFGTYEDDCHGKPTKLPHGYDTFNIPSMDEVKGTYHTSGKVFDNETDGEAVEFTQEELAQMEIEEEILDVIQEEEFAKDEVFEDDDTGEETWNQGETIEDSEDAVDITTIQEIRERESRQNAVDTSSAAPENTSSASGSRDQKLITKEYTAEGQRSTEPQQFEITPEHMAEMGLPWMLLGVTSMVIVVLAIAMCVLCYQVQTMRRERKEYRARSSDYARRHLDQDSEVDLDKPPSAVQINNRSSLRGTTSELGLVQPPSAMSGQHTMMMEHTQSNMMSGNTPIGTMNTNNNPSAAVEKLNNADEIVQPDDVRFQFNSQPAQQQQQPANQGTANALQNPFASSARTLENDADNKGADLELSMDGSDRQPQTSQMRTLHVEARDDPTKINSAGMPMV